MEVGLVMCLSTKMLTSHDQYLDTTVPNHGEMVPIIEVTRGMRVDYTAAYIANAHLQILLLATIIHMTEGLFPLCSPFLLVYTGCH